jgi:hypothetical protein
MILKDQVRSLSFSSPSSSSSSSTRYLVVSASRRRRQGNVKEEISRETPESSEFSPYDLKIDSSSGTSSRNFERLDSDSLDQKQYSALYEKQHISRTTYEEDAEAVDNSRSPFVNFLLSVDCLLLFGVDGVLPEIINGRCAMIGLMSGFANEILVKKSLTEQLSYNISHGITPLIVVLVILSSLLPSILIYDEGNLIEVGSRNDHYLQPWLGKGTFRYKIDSRFRGKRAYAVDPAALDFKYFKIESPLGYVGLVPFAEIVNARFSMLVLICTFLIEGYMGHGLLSP